MPETFQCGWGESCKWDVFAMLLFFFNQYYHIKTLIIWGHSCPGGRGGRGGRGSRGGRGGPSANPTALAYMAGRMHAGTRLLAEMVLG